MGKNTAPVKATVTANEVVTRTLSVTVGKETAVLVITNGVPTVARKQGTPLARELAKAVLNAIVVAPAAETEVEETPAPKNTAPREVRHRAPRAEMQAARLRGEIPCLKGKDPYGVDLSTLGIFNTEWEVGMATSQDGAGANAGGSDENAPASTQTEF